VWSFKLLAVLYWFVCLFVCLFWGENSSEMPLSLSLHSAGQPVLVYVSSKQERMHNRPQLCTPGIKLRTLNNVLDWHVQLASWDRPRRLLTPPPHLLTPPHRSVWPAVRRNSTSKHYKMKRTGQDSFISWRRSLPNLNSNGGECPRRMINGWW